MKNKDYSAILPNGEIFDFWEEEREIYKEIHVNNKKNNASDNNDGSVENPLKTINKAAQIAKPGTRILIHEGIYRETVQPKTGGNNAKEMIIYEAFNKEKVIIKASVEVKDFKPSTGWRLNRNFKEEYNKDIKVWEIELNEKDFMGYNPFCCMNILHDRLFIEYDKTDMTTYLNRRGMVFIDGKPMKQVPLYYMLSESENTYWVEANGQKVHIRLSDDESPEKHLVEVTNREQCFAPKVPFLSYILVRGLTFAHAATGAPVPQRGAISCFRGHHWIIEDCEIEWSNAVGIDCGNECWHHPRKENQMIGYSILRRNTIKDVGVCAIAGMFVSNMLIEDNYIIGTGWQRMELSWEAGGIKLHNSIKSLIRRNIIKKCYGCDALWLDVGNENNRITSNLFIDGIESREHIFIECTRDEENMIDNNIIWNVEGRYDKSNVKEKPGSSGWYEKSEDDIINGYGIYLEGTDRLKITNNLIGNCNKAGFFAKIVAFRLQKNRGGTSRNNKLINNIFYNCGEAAIILPNEYNTIEGNCYSKMPPGYLRIMYPEPEMCLDLKTWKEFCGFDKAGDTSEIEINIDSDELKMEINIIDNILKTKSNDQTYVDFNNNIREEIDYAGPFTNYNEKKVCFNIDPRKL